MWIYVPLALCAVLFVLRIFEVYTIYNLFEVVFNPLCC